MLPFLDVVEDADGERDVEGGIVVRQRRSVGHAVLDVRVRLARVCHHRLRDVHTRERAHVRTELPVGEPEPAADVERVERTLTQVATSEVEQPPHLRLDIALVRLPRERDRLGDRSLVPGRVAVEAGRHEPAQLPPSGPATAGSSAGCDGGSTSKPLVSRTTYSGRSLTSS